MTIYLVIDFEKVRRFLRYDAHALDVLAYFVLKMPPSPIRSLRWRC